MNIVHLLIYHRTHLIKWQIMKYGIILLGVHFKLRHSKLKLLEIDQKCLRHGSGTKPHLSLSKRDNTTKKKFGGKINLLWNTGHLDKNNDVKYNIFCCLIPLIRTILL